MNDTVTEKSNGNDKNHTFYFSAALKKGSILYRPEVARRIPEGELILFDIQREMLDKSQAKLQRTGHKNFRLVQGRAETLPFDANTFDVVFMVTVLVEVADPQACVASIGKVLRPGGLLSLTEPSRRPGCAHGSCASAN